MNERISFIDGNYRYNCLSNKMQEVKSELLKRRIIKTLHKQGFDLSNRSQVYINDKDKYKLLQSNTVIEFRKKRRKTIEALKKVAIPHFRNGKEIDPAKIKLSLIEVKSNSKEAKLFKFWNFTWWSMPWQQAYGRQIRFLIWDEFHDAPFGIIGLQSPILRQSIRDKYLQITPVSRDFWVNQSMNAQRVGALPPYNYLLGGKMVASTLVSSEIRKAYENKYKNRTTIIQNRQIPSQLLFITTTSAFGKSSLYNRLKYKNHLLAKSLGYTKGFGSFHIPDELYKEIIVFLEDNGIDTKRKYGDGPSKKIKLLNKAFTLLKLPNYAMHGLKREFFIFELCDNLHNAVHRNEKPIYYNYTFQELFEWWLETKCIPRSQRVESWRSFDKERFLSSIYLTASFQ